MPTPDHSSDLSQFSRDELVELLTDAHGDIFLHQVILGESSVPKRWHQAANALLEKYRPVTDRIQIIVDAHNKEAGSE